MVRLDRPASHEGRFFLSSLIMEAQERDIPLYLELAGCEFASSGACAVVLLSQGRHGDIRRVQLLQHKITCDCNAALSDWLLGTW